MPDSKISGLNPRTTVDGTELVPVAYSGSTLKVLVSAIKDYIIGFFTNKATVLDKLGVADGKLTFDGTQVQQSATTASGSSTEVQFRNTVTGALDSDSTFKYDKATGVLIAGKSFKDIPSLTSVFAGFESGINNTGTANTGFGNNCLKSNIGGINNASFGTGSMQANTTGIGNVAIGTSALSENISGSDNTAVGAGAAGGYTDRSLIIAIGRAITKTVKNNYDFICGIASYLFLEGNMAAGTRWFRINAAQLIRSFEIDSVAPVVTGTVTSWATNTLTDSSKTYVLNQYANFVVEKTTVGGEKEQRVILSNTVAGQLTVRDNWTVNPVAGDTFKIITTTIITADNLGSIYRFNLSSGYDHALILPTVSDTFNRAFCEFYIEGHANGAVLHKFPATGQLIQGQPKTEMVANREMVRLLSHASGTFHWDVENSVGLEAFISATAATQNVVAANTTFTPITTAITIKRSRRFSQVNIGGQLWIKYTSSLARSMRLDVKAAVINQSAPATTITVGIRLYKASAGTTTDYTLSGSEEQLSTTGLLRNFSLSEIFDIETDDRLQIIHKASNNNNYDITPSLQIK